MAKKRSFAESLKAAEERYGTYNPETEGYGTPNQWRHHFEKVMGIKEAEQILGKKSPLQILGFTATPTLKELNQRFRELIKTVHPDTGGTVEQAQEVIAAYTKLKSQINGK